VTSACGTAGRIWLTIIAVREHGSRFARDPIIRLVQDRLLQHTFEDRNATQLRAKKPRLFHLMPENIFPHLGHGNANSRCTPKLKRIIYSTANKPSNLAVPKSLGANALKALTPGTYKNRASHKRFLVFL
jgi:hypothetical protein